MSIIKFDKTKQLYQIIKQNSIENYMGGITSEFEQEFYERYSYIQHLDDPLFGLVKIYRKNVFRYDYIMVLEINVNLLSEEQLQNVQERLQMIRSYQNEATLRIYHYKIDKSKKSECRENRLVIYAQYLNRNLRDYFSALRTNQNFILEIDEVIYVLKNVAKGCLALKKMGIHTVDLSSSKIFISTDGEALVSPLFYVLESLKCTTNEEQIPPLRYEYQKYSVAKLYNYDIFPVKEQFFSLFLQLSGNVRTQNLRDLNFIHRILQSSPNIQAIYQNLPETGVQTLQIEQMYREENMTGQFYHAE